MGSLNNEFYESMEAVCEYTEERHYFKRKLILITDKGIDKTISFRA